MHASFSSLYLPLPNEVYNEKLLLSVNIAKYTYIINEVIYMQVQRKTLTQLSIPICFETLFYMLSGMVDTLMLSSVSDQAVGAVGIRHENTASVRAG